MSIWTHIAVGLEYLSFVCIQDLKGMPPMLDYDNISSSRFSCVMTKVCEAAERVIKWLNFA